MTAQPKLALPASVLVEVRRALGKQTDDVAASRALQDAGFATGASIFNEFVEELDVDPGELSPRRFFELLGDHLAERGWGRVSHTRVHPGLGMLRAEEWCESDAEGGEAQAGCWFTSGVLERMFSRVGGGSIAVVEADCRSKGNGQCAFLFGSRDAIERIRQLLLEHDNVDDALAGL